MNRLTLSPTADTNDDPQHVDAWSVAHVPDPRAAISGITRTLDEYPGGDPQQIAVITPDHDAAGNIVYDGTYIYQYDAWSRLVQVNLAAQPPPGGGPAVGDTVPGTMQLAGPLVKHFTYDGLGRLVRVLSPYPEPGATPPEGWTVAPVRSERLYYDGVRRIQEVYTDPLLALGESAALGDPEAQGEVSQGGEEEGQILEGEEEQIESGSGEPGGEEPPGPPPNTFITYLEREYLWGPGDGITSGAGAGLDELVAIFDIDRRAWWTLLDASGDVVAIVDDGDSTTHGYGTGSPTTSEARLCAQFCYDAYGSLLTVQGLHPYPDPRTGHKGLHLDRLDAGVADPLTGAAISRHAVGATHSYFVRNRHYSPELGRFLQRDPNATSATALGAMAYAGVGLDPTVDEADLADHIGDGVGVYGYVQSSPLMRVDPLGLAAEDDTYDWQRQMFLGDLPDFDDPFDQADAIGLQHILSGSFALQRANAKIKRRMKLVRGYEALGWAWTDLIMDRDEAILTGLIGGIFFSKMCFVEGTLVSTPDGEVPIETLALGDRVLSWPDPMMPDPSSDGAAPQEAQWVEVALTYVHEDGAATKMTLLRRADAVQRLGFRPGMAARVVMPEMGIDGWAQVNAITSAAGPEDVRVPHVSGTFRTSRAAVVEVVFEDGGEPLVGTPSHPVWSLDRSVWVPLGELQPGERVAAVFVSADGVESTNDGVDHAADANSSSTPRGERRVREMRACAQSTAVYNVEVSPTHTYVAVCVWVHNECVVQRMIKDARLQRLAREAGVNTQVQKGLDHLMRELSKGNLAAGGFKSVARGILEVRHHGSGARVYFSQVKDGVVQVVAKSSKSNQEMVIRILKEMFGG